MRTRVTAILVARSSGEWLERTLEGIAAQTRRPDRVIGVANGGRESVVVQLGRGAERVVGTQGTLSFGAAVQQGVAASPEDRPADEGHAASPGEQVQDWFWLLSEDSAPEPEALEQILSTVLRAPSVAIAGPKLVAWDQPDRIIELGQSLTRSGERWLLRRQERDQQQYDHLQDVLGVGPVGMLVRADVWQQLGGFDPAYRVYDDGLDLSVRARLAGYRVVVAPTSRVRFAQRGIAGPRIDRSRRVLRVAHREARTAQLHRRIAYAPPVFAALIWLALPLIAVARMAWALIRERPGHLWVEFAAAFRVFFRPGALIASRRRVRRANSAGWGAVRPLRIDPKSVRTARIVDREAILVAQGRVRPELHFISGGGLAVLITAAVAAIALTWWALTQTSLTGGGLAPLSPLGELWQHTRTIDGAPADPFAWVLAVLGTLTFWNPSHGVVLVMVAAIPLAALGGWIWAAQLTTNTAGRALLALGWAFSPVLLGSLASGRLTTLILAIVLPWLLLAASRCRESWSWAGLTSLLAAVALACAPVLLPAAAVLYLLAVLLGFALWFSYRGIGKVLATAIAPLAVFAPKLLALLQGADPLELLRDPGLTPVFTPASQWQLLIGFPEYGLEGWGGIFWNLGIGIAPVSAMLGALLLPIVLLAAVGLFTGRARVTLPHAVFGGLGLFTAFNSAQLQFVSIGPDAVALWTGSGLALYWIAMLGLAAIGAGTLRKAAAPVVAVGLVAALVVVAPLGVKLATANTGLVAGESGLPAIVQAAGAQDASLRTLALTAVGEQAIRAELITGPGLRLDEVRTALHSSAVTEQDRWIAQLVAALSSTGDSTEANRLLAEHGIGFVLLITDGGTAERSQLQSALDRHVVLENAGQTGHGLLWRVSGVAGVEPAPDDRAGGWLSNATALPIWWAQLVVLLGMALLALPTGEVVERPERRRRPAREAEAAAPPPVEVDDGADDEDPAAAAAVPAPASAPAEAEAPAAEQGVEGGAR